MAENQQDLILSSTLRGGGSGAPSEIPIITDAQDNDPTNVDPSLNPWTGGITAIGDNQSEFYAETPIGQGRFREQNTNMSSPDSESPEMNEVSLTAVFTKIQRDVQNFVSIEPNTDKQWLDNYISDYNSLYGELEDFQQRCVIERKGNLIPVVEGELARLKTQKGYLDLLAINQGKNPPTVVLTPSRLDTVVQSGSNTAAHNPTVSRPESETPEAFNIQDYVDQIKKLPMLESAIDKIIMLEDIDKVVEELEKFDPTKIEELSSEVKNRYDTIEGLVKGLQTVVEKDTSTCRNSVKESENRCIAMEKKIENLEYSLSAVTRWVVDIKKVVNNNRNTNTINQHTTLQQKEQITKGHESVVRSCPSSPLAAPHDPPNTMKPSNSRSHSIISLSDSTINKVHEKRLKRLTQEINDLIVEDTTMTSISDEVIIDLHANVLNDVIRLAKECEDKCESYAKLQDIDYEILETASTAAASGYSWTSQLKRLYRERQLHVRTGTNRAFNGALNLKKFTGDASETIYEFFKKFDQLTEANYTNDQKATLLYSSYLSDRLKQESITMRNDFEGIRKWLIQKFGRVNAIVEGKLNTLRTCKFPGQNSSISSQADYYCQVYSILAGIQGLPKSSGISSTELEIYAYSHESLLNILRHIPQTVVAKFRTKLREDQVDPEFFQGKDSFQMLMNIIQVEFTDMDFNAKLAKVSEKPHGKDKSSHKDASHEKQVHSATNSNNEQSNSSDNVSSGHQTVHYQGSPRSKRQANPQKTKKKFDVWYDNKFKFPCPIQNHSHELGSCTEFFGLSEKDRGKVSFLRTCYSCCGPKDKCPKTCQNLSKMPTRLICQDCTVDTKLSHKSPFNLLFCFKKNHTKVKQEEFLNDCEKWIPEFSAKKMGPSVKSLINLVAFTSQCPTCNHKSSECSCVSPISYSSPIDPEAETPTIDTSTGELVETDESLLVSEVQEESFYVMQVLNLRGRNVLCFFDRGANQHLIEGKIAEELNLKVVNPKSVPIGVVGGGRIWTQFGMYSVALGPTEEGKYHELKCQGIPAITREFPLYQMKPINEMVKESGKLNPGTPLPKFIGGSRAELLVGIKDAFLDPVTLFVLPSGLGVYKSQLKDAYNSRICYGGPHRLFSEINQKSGGNFNHINVFFTEMVNSYRNSLYPALACATDASVVDDDEFPISTQVDPLDMFEMTVDESLGTKMYPTAISSMDTVIFGGVDDKSETPHTDLDSIKREVSLESKHALDSGVHYCSVFKARVPIDKLIKIVDDDDISKIVNYRCPECAKCIKCLQSNRTKTMSLQESMEQDVISKSVHIDYEKQKVFVDYPFIRQPVEYLKSFHNGKTDNKYQAMAAYKSQCRKPFRIKEGIIKAHAELVEKGFMVRLSDLTKQQRNLISSNGFRHYYPWSAVEKDSVSTPVRLVVDPSRTGLNMILAKGENNMAKIFDVLLRNRCKKFVFTSDISKLYNQLHLNDAALPYSLFLFSDQLDPNTEPETWVLLRAWYGVRSTGNQSGEALDSLGETSVETHPLANHVIADDRYVDDLFSGTNTPDELPKMITEVTNVLGRGGFKLKFIARSGEAPPSEASTDGTSIKILGYKWSPEEDCLQPGFEELNFNPKKRGVKKPNAFPVVQQDDVSRILATTKLSRRAIVSKVAEMYDPIGIWEPFKLQLKLDLSLLNGFDWDTVLPNDLQNHWEVRFKQFLQIPNMSINRCVVPMNAVNPNSIRLICVSDAAESAGGAALYAGYLLPDESYSCQLLTAKSKLLNSSIPRNELEGILLMSELAYLAKKSLGNLVSEVYYFTDSTIALCWCHNVNKKLRMYVFNRVATIRRFMEWAVGDIEELPLYHIDGDQNIADLLTKVHDLTPDMLGVTSLWQQGLDWMKQSFKCMSNITSFADLTVSASDASEVTKECFIELDDKTLHSIQVGVDPTGSTPHLECPKEDKPICHTQSRFPLKCISPTKVHQCGLCKLDKSSIFLVRKGPPNIDCLVQVVKVGWRKSVSIMTILLKFAHYRIHCGHNTSKKHALAKSIASKCQVCRCTNKNQAGIVTRSRKEVSSLKFFKVANKWLGEDYLFRTATKELLVLEKQEKLEKKFAFKDGIFYFTGRLDQQFPVVTADLDINVFFDNAEFKSVVPVVSSSSPIFYAYLMLVHDKLRPHSGIELTYREISKKMHVIKNPRQIIAKVRHDCTHCRIMFKKTLELEMANHGPSRTIMAPPFHSVQIDIVYKFKAKAWKRSRQTFDVYALIIVCLLSSATSILVLEGLETQDVVQALERHSGRYGIPAHVFVDAGSQLVSLQNVDFSLRDVNLAVNDSMGMSVRVSTPKSHEERGRVEAKVKVLRSMLSKLSVRVDVAVTTIAWETIFTKIANQIDSLPLCKGNSSNVYDFGFEIITPNRYKLGRNNQRALDDNFIVHGNTPVEVLEVCRKYQQTWLQIMLDRLHHFMPRPSKWTKTDKVGLGDVVVFIHQDPFSEKLFNWLLGKVVEVHDRKLSIEYFGPGKLRKQVVSRCPRQVSKVFGSDDLPVNTVDH